MKNVNEQIVKYLDGQLSEEEIIEFEKRLLFDKALRNSFSEFQKVNKLFSSEETPKVNEEYLSNIVPRFRQSLERDIKISPFQKVSFGVIILIMIICSYTIFNPGTNTGLNSIESITAGLTDEQFNEARNYLTDNSWSVSSEDLVYQVVNEDDFTFDGILQSVPAGDEINVLSDYQINDIESFAGEDELQLAYEELLAKRIL